jgi:hypothetical protein
MRRWITVMLLMVLAALLFIAGALTAWTRGWGDSTTKLHILNVSSKPIAKLTIHLTSCGRTSITTVEQTGAVKSFLPAGERTSLRVLPCGEGLVALEASTEDGVTLKTVPTYIESGYYVEAKFGANGFEIKSTTGLTY